MDIETFTRKWGNSIAVIIPNEIVVKENLRENEPVVLDLKKKKTKAGLLFGRFSDWDESAQKIKDSLREGWD